MSKLPPQTPTLSSSFPDGTKNIGLTPSTATPKYTFGGERGITPKSSVSTDSNNSKNVTGEGKREEGSISPSCWGI